MHLRPRSLSLSLGLSNLLFLGSSGATAPRETDNRRFFHLPTARRQVSGPARAAARRRNHRRRRNKLARISRRINRGR